MEHSTVDRTVDRSKLGFAGALIASGLLVGLLLVWLMPDASAQTATPDGPERVFALTDGDDLLRFDGDNPNQVVRKNITGLRTGESLVGIDFRPSSQVQAAQGLLYGVGDQSYIYTINPRTAVATPGPQLTAAGVPVVLRGERFGIDFNPVVDRLRIVSDLNQNLRVNVDTGDTLLDRDLQYAMDDRNFGQDPEVTGAAYRNSQPSAFDADPTTMEPGKTTQLYDIDANTDDVALQNPPNDGTLNTVGRLRVDTNRLVGFDIVTRGASPAGDRGFAALQRMGSGSSSFFYSVNLDTGEATRIGRIGNNSNVEGLAIPIGQR